MISIVSIVYIVSVWCERSSAVEFAFYCQHLFQTKTACGHIRSRWGAFKRTPHTHTNNHTVTYTQPPHEDIALVLEHPFDGLGTPWVNTCRCEVCLVSAPAMQFMRCRQLI